MDTSLINGGADLTVAKRVKVNRHFAEFVSVGALDKDGQPNKVFFEGEPIIFRVRLLVKHPVEGLQMGCGIKTLDLNSRLFTVPSDQYEQRIAPGQYVTTIALDPNYLRAGDYVISLEMFAAGLRQDRIPEAMRIKISSHIPTDANRASFSKWVTGYLCLDYKWDGLTRSE